MKDESSAVARPVRSAVNPAMRNEIMTAGPAIPEATPIRTKMPVPMIAPMPTLAAPQSPRVRFSSAKPCTPWLIRIMWCLSLSSSFIPLFLNRRYGKGVCPVLSLMRQEIPCAQLDRVAAEGISLKGKITKPQGSGISKE